MATNDETFRLTTDWNDDADGRVDTVELEKEIHPRIRSNASCDDRVERGRGGQAKDSSFFFLFLVLLFFTTLNIIVCFFFRIEDHD